MNQQDTYDHLLYEANVAITDALVAYTCAKYDLGSKHELAKAEKKRDVAIAAFVLFASRNGMAFQFKGV